jgi:hypothetical protein
MLGEAKFLVKSDPQITDRERESSLRKDPSKVELIDALKLATATQPNKLGLEGFKRSRLEAIHEERAPIARHIRRTVATVSVAWEWMYACTSSAKSW